MTDEIILELARLERAAHERARKRNADQQVDDRSWLDVAEQRQTGMSANDGPNFSRHQNLN